MFPGKTLTVLLKVGAVPPVAVGMMLFIGAVFVSKSKIVNPMALVGVTIFLVLPFLIFFFPTDKVIPDRLLVWVPLLAEVIFYCASIYIAFQ